MPDPKDKIENDNEPEVDNVEQSSNIDDSIVSSDGEQEDIEDNEEKNEPVSTNLINNDTAPKLLGNDGNSSAKQIKEVDPQKQAAEENGNKDDNAPKPDADLLDKYSSSPTERLRVLKKKLVTDYRKKKEDEKQALLDGKVSHSDELKENGKIDDIASGLRGVGTVGSVVSAIGPYLSAGVVGGVGGLWTGTAGLAGALSGGKDKAKENMKEPWDTTKGLASTIVNNQTSKDVFTSAGVVGSTASAAGAGFSLYSNIRRQKKDKNKNHKEAASRRKWADMASMAGSVTGGLSSAANLGLFGKRATEEGSTQQKIAGGLDIASGASSIASSSLNLWANYGEKAAHKKTAEDADRYSREHGNAADESLNKSREKIQKYKKRKESGLSLEEKVDLGMARKQRHTAKAQKYAMAQAAKMHKLRSEESTKGLIGTIGAGFGGLGSMLTGSLKLAGKTKGILGDVATGLSAVGGILQLAGFITDTVKGKKEKKKKTQKGQEIVEEYLKGKIDKIKQEASGMDLKASEEAALGREKGKNITDDEAKRIALMRLGIDIPDEMTDIPAKAYDMAFEKLTEKRANNIMKAGEAEKGAMLSMLGLEKDASFEDVVAVLKGD